MIEQLPKLKFTESLPSFYDGQSVTILELASVLHGKMTEIINAFNTLSESVDQRLSTFTASTNEDIELFKHSIRQEFQDFIDVMQLKSFDIDGMKENIQRLQSEINDIKSQLPSA